MSELVSFKNVGIEKTKGARGLKMAILPKWKKCKNFKILAIFLSLLAF